MHKFDVTVCLYSGVLTDVFSGKATLFQKLGIETRSRKNWQYELKQIFSFIRDNISDIFVIVNFAANVFLFGQASFTACNGVSSLQRLFQNFLI